MPKTHVLISTTSCKRSALLMRMYQSMLRWFDFGERSEFELSFLVVDDNSPSDELDLFEQSYPFCRLLRKRPDERGHARSMNMILDIAAELGTTFLLHIEDDMEFVSKVSLPQLVGMMLHGKAAFAQILLNQDYSETGMGLGSGADREVFCAGQRLIRHNHVPGNPGHEYWPGFSLRPGIISLAAIAETGRFTDALMFERNYADKFYSLGFRVAFLPGFCHLHTGRLTTEQDKLNSYDMNGSEQYRIKIPCWQIGDRDSTQPGFEMFESDQNLQCWENHSRLWSHLLTTHGNLWLVRETGAEPLPGSAYPGSIAGYDFDVLQLCFKVKPGAEALLAALPWTPLFWPGVEYAAKISESSGSAYLITRKGCSKLLRAFEIKPPKAGDETWLQQAAIDNPSGAKLSIAYAWPMLYRKEPELRSKLSDSGSGSNFLIQAKSS